MISVIIPTINRAPLLEKTLLSLTRQTIKPNTFEVLVIDNGSSDNTPNIVSQFESAFAIKYIVEKNPGLHEGRHRGLLESSGDVLTFADDDIEALSSWLEGVSESFEDPQVGLVGGKNIANYESAPPAWLEKFWVTVPSGKYITYFSLLDLGDETRIVDPHYVFGCNFSVRKSIVLDAKGFHPDGMPQSMIKYRGDGETYVATHVEKTGFKAIYNPKASVKHWVPSSRMNLDYLKKRSFAEGITQSYVDTRARYKTPKSGSKLSHVLSGFRNSVKGLLLSENEKQVRKSFIAGYAYHQEELRKDTELLPWVLRDTYM